MEIIQRKFKEIRRFKIKMESTVEIGSKEWKELKGETDEQKIDSLLELINDGSWCVMDWSEVELDKTNQKNKAIEAAIPCLEDWIRTTGFGTVNKRDREALALLKESLEEVGICMF